jgi:GTPase SAR1 family protein
VELILWDLAGEDEFFQLRMSYIRGASGYLLVADGTRRATLEKALELNERIVGQVGELPFVMLLNKSDLSADWELTEADLQSVAASKRQKR